MQEARRLAHLVENVLHLSRTERRLVRVCPVPTPAAAAVREIVERFAPLAGAAAVRIRTELDETLVAMADPAALHQIVINLLDNAVKHGGTGPITVRAVARDGRARIEIEDAGAGSLSPSGSGSGSRSCGSGPPTRCPVAGSASRW